MLWLDPTSLRPANDGTGGYWCDRSGHANHARHVLAIEPMRLGRDEDRPVADGLNRSLELRGNWMALPSGESLSFSEEDFAVIVAAATPLDPGDTDQTSLYELDDQVTLSVYATDYCGLAEGRFQAPALGSPSELDIAVQTGRDVYDRQYHLYTLRRYSTNILQLRLNGAAPSTATAREGFDAGTISVPGSPYRLAAIGANDMSVDATSKARGRVAAVVVLKGAPGCGPR